MYRPKSFSGKESSEVKLIKGFEQTVIMLSKYTSKDPKKMTVLAFYQALETINSELKTKTRLNGKSGKGVGSRN